MGRIMRLTLDKPGGASMRDWLAGSLLYLSHHVSVNGIPRGGDRAVLVAWLDAVIAMVQTVPTGNNPEPESPDAGTEEPPPRRSPPGESPLEFTRYRWGADGPVPEFYDYALMNSENSPIRIRPVAEGPLYPRQGHARPNLRRRGP